MNFDVIKTHLEQEGYCPQFDEDGDLIFRAEGKTLLVKADAGDESFVRLIIPNIWEIESDEERLKAYRCASEVSMGIKAAKVFVSNRDSVWTTVESFYPDAQAFCCMFQRCLGVALTAVRNFAESMENDEWSPKQVQHSPHGDGTYSPDDDAQRNAFDPDGCLYRIFQILCLRGEFDPAVSQSFWMVLTAYPLDGTPGQTMEYYLAVTKDMARRELKSDDVDFLDFPIPVDSDCESIEDAYCQLWKKASSISEVPVMASIRLSMIKILGDERQRELIGAWNPA